MQTLKTELSEVIYNAADQAFEAKVIVYEGQGQFSYPCSVPGHITMAFEAASEKLAAQALRKHGAPQPLRSKLMATALPKLRRIVRPELRRGLPLGQYGFFRGRAA